MSEFIRVPRAFKKRSKRSVLASALSVSNTSLHQHHHHSHPPVVVVDDKGAPSAGSSSAAVVMGRKPSFKEKEKKSFKRGSVKERWLLTRKTWKYMTDAGRRLLPEGVGNKAEDIPKIEQYFQDVCRNEAKFLVWRRKCSYPGASLPIPRRRWKRPFHGTVSPKKASSADEAEDEYIESLEQVQYEQLMIDMLRNYLDIKEDDDNSAAAASAGAVGGERGSDLHFPPISTTTSMISLVDSASYNTTTTTTMADINRKENYFNQERGLRSGAGAASATSGGKTGSSGALGSCVMGSSGDFRSTSASMSNRDSFMQQHQRLSQALSATSAAGVGGRGYGQQQSAQHHQGRSQAHQLKSNLPANTPFSLFTSSRDVAPVHLMANLKRFRGSPLIDQITPEVLNDKVKLRKIYEQLKASQRMNRLLSAKAPATRFSAGVPQYQRSALGVHTTFAFPELSGKSRSAFRPFNKTPESNSSSSSYLVHYDTSNSNTSSLYGIDERTSTDNVGPRRPERRGPQFYTQGIQTDAIPLPVLNDISTEFKRQLAEEEAMLREEEAQLHEPDPVTVRNERRNSEDVSQSVSDTIKRYLRMARKKPKQDDVNRFKRINYDRNLRNIKAKGETTKIGDDDGNCKGCQTEEDWIVKSYSDLSKDAPASYPPVVEAQTTMAVRPTTLPRGKSSTKQEAASSTTPISSPSSPGILTSSSNIFHTSTQFLSNLFGHSSGASNVEGSSNDSIYASLDPAMQKSKSSSNVGHLVSRKIWKSRSKSQSRPTVKPQWTPQGNCIWTSSQGHKIKLKESALNELTEVERKTLYGLAIGKINQFNLGVNTDLLIDSVTSRSSAQKPVKRKALLLKRKALTTGFFDSSKDDSKNSSSSPGRVFGLTLEQCMENEVKEQSSRSASTKSERRARNSLSSLMDPNTTGYRVSGSCESLPSKTIQLSDNDLLKGSLSQFDIRRNSHEEEMDEVQLEGLERSDRPQVPSLIVTCVQHLEKFGLQSVGIFRKSTSKKRVRQLREDFDQGILLELDQDTCPHDVATLLKEFLRDLPEPLLCRRLYQPFVNTQKIRNRRLQFEAISYLVQLLPVVHRDTLYYLLKFLAKVARFANDVQSASGQVISEGNKMDSNNLATIFAPNILHNAVPGQVTSEQEVEERLDVINVIRIMIDHYEDLYRISAETIDEIYLNMIDSHPSQLDVLCDRLDFTINKGQESDSSNPLSPTSPPPALTTAELLEANKQKRLYAREEFLHQNSSVKGDRQSAKLKSANDVGRRRFRDSHQQEEVSKRHDMRSASIDSEDVFSTGSSTRRRMSSPFSLNNVLTASLKIPVQMSNVSNVGDEMVNIPYIEDASGEYAATAGLARRGTGTSSQVVLTDSRKSSSSGTVTGTLSLVQSPSLTMSPTTSNSTSPDHRTHGQMFFGDDDFPERVLHPKTFAKTVAATDTELRKSSSMGSTANKKLFDTKAPVKQKLSIHPSSLMSPIAGSVGGSKGSGHTEQKLTAAISSIGGAVLRSKTADFERFLIGQNVEQKPERTKGPIYKRKELISSAHNSSK